MIDPKQDPIAAAREALDALNYGGKWDNIDVVSMVRNLLAVIDGSDVPPTEAETRENTWWFVSSGSPHIVCFVSGSDTALVDNDGCVWRRCDVLQRFSLGRWVPLNWRDFRPRPRPVVPR